MAIEKRPTVFIGSSSEGLPVANALKRKFGKSAIVDVWNTGKVFKPGDNFLESLLTASSLYEFAILVFTADDTTTSRAQTHATARDNVLFEYGLFLGRVGKRRAHVVVQDRLHMPSDLLGIHFEKFALDAEGKPTAAFAKVGKKIVDDILHRHEHAVEFSQLPSTALAIGYFENFLSRVLDQLDNFEPLEIKDKRVKPAKLHKIHYKTFTLNLVIPDDLKLVELSTLGSLIKGLTQIAVSSSNSESKGALRDFPFYIQALPAPDATHLELFDFPTTMKSARRAIQKIFPSTHVGKDDKQTMAEQREIANFERTLRLLLSDNPFWEARVKYRYLSEFVPKGTA